MISAMYGLCSRRLSRTISADVQARARGVGCAAGGGANVGAEADIGAGEIGAQVVYRALIAQVCMPPIMNAIHVFTRAPFVHSFTLDSAAIIHAIRSFTRTHTLITRSRRSAGRYSRASGGIKRGDSNVHSGRFEEQARPSAIHPAIILYDLGEF